MFVTSLRAITFGCCLASAGAAVAQSYSVYKIDPFDVPAAPVFNPSANSASMWQMDPFGVGYDLLGGYRPIYAGARQSIGHEIIPTRADGNGYVYRPVYEASPGYHYTRGGALIIEYPQQHPTRADAAFPTLPPAQPITLPPGSYGELPVPYDVPLQPPYVPQPPTRRSGPREF